MPLFTSIKRRREIKRLRDEREKHLREVAAAKARRDTRRQHEAEAKLRPITHRLLRLGG